MRLGFSYLAFLVIPLASGCLGDTAPDSEATGTELGWEAAEGLNGTERITLYKTNPAPRPAAVQICTEVGGEPAALERQSALIPPETGHLAIRVNNADEVVGFQVGNRLDGGPVTWLDPVVAGERDFEVPVTPGQTEDEQTGFRWEFVYRYTLEGLGFDCYSGPVFASHPILIEAVRGTGIN